MLLTRLTGVYIKKQLVIRLRFGDPSKTEWLEHGITHYWFRPGQMFAVLWWARLSPRKQIAGFAVAEALRAGEQGYHLPGVFSGAGTVPGVRVHAFLKTRCVGRDRGVVDRADALIRQLEREDIDPCEAPSAYYRAAGQSLRVGRAPRPLVRTGLDRYLRSVGHGN